MKLPKLLTIFRPDPLDAELGLLARTYQACHGPDQKRAGAHLVADRLDDMAARVGGARGTRLRDAAQQWHALAEAFADGAASHPAGRA